MACKKEIQQTAPAIEEGTVASEHDKSGFAENDMVMYWNEKTAIVLGYPSAHATYGGTTAEVLRLFFGTDNTEIELRSATLPKIRLILYKL